MRRYFTALMGLLLVSMAAAAPIDTYEFKDAKSQKRATDLAAELRCPQCQNQNLHDSNSPIAMDMRLQVYQMVEEGKSNEEIITYFTSRYGDFVRYRPAFDNRTYMLWLGPVLFLMVGVGIAFLFAQRQRRDVAGEVSVSAADQEKLAKLLDKDQ